MKIIVAIIVYDRLHNIDRWIKCWNLSEQHGADFIIIHNYDTEDQQIPFRNLCEANNVKYIPRKNTGMDIGALQDVFRGRLEGFPNEWDYLFWCPDDTIPMSKKFLSYYIKTVGGGTGVACLEISKEVKTHIRTCAFMIDQGTASQINFPCDPIITKADCYQFEHRSNDAFYEQVKKLNKSIIQIVPDIKQAPLWDTHCRAGVRRWAHHYHEFPK